MVGQRCPDKKRGDEHKMYIYVENNVWKLTAEITAQNEEFNPREVEIDSIENLLEFAKDIGAEGGELLKDFFDSRYNDSYFVYSDEQYTVLASGGNYYLYNTAELPETI